MTIESTKAKALRDAALDEIERTIPRGHVLPYELSGGEESPRPWRVWGFFAEVVSEGRLVCEFGEFMVGPGPHIVLVRVYRESPLEVLFTARVADWRGLCDRAIHCFLAEIQGESLVNVVMRDLEIRESFPENFSELRLILYPIPPPVEADWMNDAAEAAFQKAVSLEQSGDLATASAEFARATELDGTDPRYWINRGVALLNLRHFAEAVRCLQIGIDLKPHYGEADARLFLADALWLAGRKREAEEEWLAVSKMTPSYPAYDNPINEAKQRLEGRRPS
jgi:tetratricopeptide (TPR) repeat protein